MTNGYMVYLLRILAAQGALASVYTDPDDPEGFSAGFVEAVDGQHVLMCDLSPWGQIDGWRVRRNQDVIQVLAGEEYEQRLATARLSQAASSLLFYGSACGGYRSASERVDRL